MFAAFVLSNPVLNRTHDRSHIARAGGLLSNIESESVAWSGGDGDDVQVFALHGVHLPEHARAKVTGCRSACS